MKLAFVIGPCVLAFGLVSGCKSAAPQFSTSVEIVQVRSFGAAGGPKTTDLEVRFDKCPGEARQIMRVSKEYGQCADKLKAGDKVPAEVTLSFNSERGTYRNEIVSLAGCKLKVDPKDEANYQTYENCSEVKASGMVVGVRCDRTRSEQLLAACPWLRRN